VVEGSVDTGLLKDAYALVGEVDLSERPIKPEQAAWLKTDRSGDVAGTMKLPEGW